MIGLARLCPWWAQLPAVNSPAEPSTHSPGGFRAPPLPRDTVSKKEREEALEKMFGGCAHALPCAGYLLFARRLKKTREEAWEKMLRGHAHALPPTPWLSTLPLGTDSLWEQLTRQAHPGKAHLGRHIEKAHCEGTLRRHIWEGTSGRHTGRAYREGIPGRHIWESTS